MPEFATLYALAELAVAMAGFASIVVLFKRGRTGGWVPADADRFNGMLLHAMAAGFFCVFPPFISVFTSDPSRIWTIASASIAVQLLLHAAVIFWLPSTTIRIRLALVLPLGLVGLQFLNVLGVWFAGDFRPYLAAVLWHIFQAGLLFVTLVFVRDEDIEGRGP